MKQFIIIQKKLIEEGRSSRTMEELKEIAQAHLLPSEMIEIFGTTEE